MKTKEEYSKQGKANMAKGARGLEITLEILNRFKFCEAWPQPGSGNKQNKKYKSDIFIRFTFAPDLIFKLKAENKFIQKIAFFRWWDKLKGEILPDHLPVITFKEDYSDTMIGIKLVDFMSILDDMWRRIEVAKSENVVVNYDNKRSAREIEFNARKILQEVKKL